MHQKTTKRSRSGMALLAVLTLPVTTIGFLVGAQADAALGTVVARGPSATVTAAATRSVTVGLPTGAQTGDLLLATLATASPGARNTVALTAPSGWTLVRRADRDKVGTLSSYRHVLGTGESTFRFTTDINVNAVVTLTAFAGADPSNPVEVSAGRVTGKQSWIDAPSVDTTTPDAVVTVYSGYKKDSSVTWAPPSGMTELADASVGGPSSSVASLGQSAAGTTGTRRATASASQDYLLALTVALRPATTTTTTTTTTAPTTTAPSTTTTTTPPASGAVPLIIDTDIFSSVDDVGALATGFGLQLRGEARVIAVTVNTRLSRPTLPTDSWKCTAAINQYYGAGAVPIGTHRPDNGTEVNVDDFLTPCARLASTATPQPGLAVDVLRRALTGQADGTVAIASVGYLENLAKLLDSPADAISPLTGSQLVARKVKSLVIMGGGYPSFPGENNLVGDVTAAQKVATTWPTKVVWSGYEVGDNTHVGSTISRIHPANSPVRVSYEAFVGANNWYYADDMTAVYHAIRPADPLLTEIGPGRNVIDSSGNNSWVSGSGNQYYLRLSDGVALGNAIETLVDTLPGATNDVTPPVVSGATATIVSPTQADVVWQTNEPADSQVLYAVAPAPLGASPLDSRLTTAHSVALTGLLPGTTYTYQVRSRDAAGNATTSSASSFTTPAATTTGPNDTFDSGVLDTSMWTVESSGSTVGVVSQALDIGHPAGSWTSGALRSVSPHDQTGRSVQVQLKRPANNGAGGTTYGETSVFVWIDSTHYLSFLIAGNSLSAWVRNGTTETNLTPSWPRYSATSMQWLRLREAGGTVYWEYASGTTGPGAWTTLVSAPAPFALTAVRVRLAAGSNATVNDVATFDNVRTI